MEAQTGTAVKCQACDEAYADRKIVIDHELFASPTYIYLCGGCLGRKPGLRNSTNVHIYLYFSQGVTDDQD